MRSIEFNKDLIFTVGEPSPYLNGKVVTFINEHQHGVSIGFQRETHQDCIYIDWSGKEVFAHQV